MTPTDYTDQVSRVISRWSNGAALDEIETRMVYELQTEGFTADTAAQMIYDRRDPTASLFYITDTMAKNASDNRPNVTVYKWAYAGEDDWIAASFTKPE